MIVGLPGTGIGGLFYVLLVLLMPLRELGPTLRGRSSLQRWRRIGVQLALVGGILSVLAAEAWLITWALTLAAEPGLPDATAAGTEVALTHLPPSLAAAPFVILALIVATVRLLVLLLPRPEPQRLLERQADA